jgi:hypothetical protein
MFDSPGFSAAGGAILGFPVGLLAGGLATFGKTFEIKGNQILYAQKKPKMAKYLFRLDSSDFQGGEHVLDNCGCGTN